MPLRFFTETTTEEIQSRLTNDVTLSWQLPLFVWLAEQGGRAEREVDSSPPQTMAELSVITEETQWVSGLLLCRAFGRRRQEITRLRTLHYPQLYRHEVAANHTQTPPEQLRPGGKATAGPR